MERTIDGRYEVQRVLGGGARGTVYLAKQAILGREVAIAVFRPTVEPAPFARELEILSDLNHPNVARILDGGRTPEGESFLVMEVVKGEPLRSALARDGGMSTRRVCAVLRDVAEGLAALHATGLAHRALRAESVVLTPDGAAKIVDLGCAVATEDARHDMFQFALLARDCLGGERTVPEEISTLVNDTLRNNASAPPSARSTADLFARVGRRSPPAPPPTKKAPNRRAGVVAAAALALATIAAAGAFFVPLALAPTRASVVLTGSRPSSLPPEAAATNPIAIEIVSGTATTVVARPAPSTPPSTRVATPRRAAPAVPPPRSPGYHDVWRRNGMGR